VAAMPTDARDLLDHIFLIDDEAYQDRRHHSPPWSYRASPHKEAMSKLRSARSSSINKPSSCGCGPRTPDVETTPQSTLLTGTPLPVGRQTELCALRTPRGTASFFLQYKTHMTHNKFSLSRAIHVQALGGACCHRPTKRSL
jgi:hypothetical protein